MVILNNAPAVSPRAQRGQQAPLTAEEIAEMASYVESEAAERAANERKVRAETPSLSDLPYPANSKE